MYTAYFDESGSPDDTPAIIVAGFVALDESWLKFEEEWNAVLMEYHVTTFHMKDYAHSNREFKSWKGDETKREKFLRALIAIIKKCALRSFAQGVVMADYHEIEQVGGRLLDFLGEAYSLCARTCIKDINLWAKKRRYDRTLIRTIFEDGAIPKGKFLERMRADKQQRPIFENKSACIQFQASDLLAYEVLKRYRDVDSVNISKPRRSFLSLSEIPGKYNWGIYTRNDLDILCKKVEMIMQED